jgi:hypothetical protein
MTNHDTGPASRSGRQLALTIAATVAILLISVLLWYGAGYLAARDCLSSAYDIPQVKAQEMTSEGCRINIGGQWSGPLPDRDSGTALAAVVTAALACVPPYLLIISRRRQR